MFAPFDVFLYRAPLTQDFNQKEIRRLFELLTRRVKERTAGAEFRLREARNINPIVWQNPNNPDEKSDPVFWQRLEVVKKK